MVKRKAMFVDDEQPVLDSYKRMLHEEYDQWDILFVDTGQRALEELSKQKIDLVLTDLKMPTMGGIELLEKISEHFPETLTTVITGYGDLNTAIRAMQLGAFNYIQKPIDIQNLKTSFSTAFERISLSEPSDEDQKKMSDAEKRAEMVETGHDYLCPGCGNIIDCAGIETFAVCSCSECGTKITIPMKKEHLILEKQLRATDYFDIYEGFDLNNEINSIIYMSNDKFELSMSKELLSNARKKAGVLNNLQHGNISPLLSFGSIGKKFYITEPKMDGQPLSEMDIELDLDGMLDIFQHVMIAAAVAHHRKITHHNICLENVHVDKRGNIRLKNFFVSWFNYVLDLLIKQPSSVSPYFISPEKAETGEEDCQGDIFSIGVLFYFLLTGRYPFNGRTETEIIHSRIQKNKPKEVFDAGASHILTPGTIEYSSPLAPNLINPDIPEEISSIVMTMLNYRPNVRGKSAEIIDIITLCQANRTKSREILQAQEQMLEDSGTRSIPMMKNLGTLPKIK